MNYFDLDYIGRSLSLVAMKEIRNSCTYVLDLCKKNNCLENSPFIFNDLDNKIFYLKVAKERDAIVLSDQNNDFIVIFDISDSYIRCKAFKLYDTFSFEDNKEKENYKNIIKLADIYLGYSDNFDNNEYVERPNLQFFKDNDLMYSEEFYNFVPILDSVYSFEEDMDIIDLITHIHKHNNLKGDINEIIKSFKSTLYSEKMKFEKLYNRMIPNNYVHTVNNASLLDSMLFDLHISLQELRRKFPEEN